MHWKRRSLALESLENRRLLTGTITQVGHFDTWDGGIIRSTDVAGIAYHPPSGNLYLADSEINEISSIFTGANIFETNLQGDQVIREITSGNTEPTGITYNEFDGFFYVTNDTGDRLITRYDSNLNNPLLEQSTADDVATANDPEGITSDPATGRLYVVSGDTGGELQVLTYTNDLEFIDRFLVEDQLNDAEGIAFHEESQHLFVLDGTQNLIVEYSLNGTFIESYDISGFSPTPESAQGLTFAPTSNPNDSPDALAIYIADGQVDNGADGRVYEAVLVPTGGNQPPTVDAGPDQTLSSNTTVQLDGTVTDDDLPSVITTWSIVSGPGTVTFGDTNAVDTTANFSGPGVYVLRLSANDGQFISTNDITISIGVLERQIASSNDDAEERANGDTRLRSSDLEMAFDGGGNQTVGLRFTDLTIPPGAEITSAIIQFTADEVNTEPTALTVRAQAADNALTFNSPDFDLSSRPTTTSQVAWNPPAWNSVGESGLAQQTPDLKSVLQEVVNRPGWASGNAAVFLITGTGERTAESIDGTAASAPRLLVEFNTNTPPTTSGLANVQVVEGAASSMIDLFAAFDDTEDADAALTYTIEQNTNPGLFAATPINPVTGVLTLDYAADAAGTATLTVRATDTAGAAVDTPLLVTISEVNDPPVRTAGMVNNLLLTEDSGATSLGLENLAYSPGGSTDENGQTLTFTVTEVPSAAVGEVLLADGVTVVAPGLYSLAEIQGMQFRGLPNTSGGPTMFSFSVTDDGTTAGAGNPLTLVESLTITVTEVNDQPERTAGTVENLLVVEDSAATSLGLAGLQFGPGGGADEAGQTLTYAVQAVPAAGLGQILLANGVTVVAPGPYTLAELQGLQFRPAPGAVGGPAEFRFAVTDNGTTTGASDPQTLVESLEITVIEFNETPTTTGIGNVQVVEDAASTVIHLFAAFDDVEDADNLLTYTIEQNTNPGLFTALPINTVAGTLTLDYAGDANGSADLRVRATDTNGLFVDAPFTVTVSEVNDSPERTAGMVNNLLIPEDSDTTSLGLDTLAYGPGGGSDETGQTLTFAVTAVPSGTLGNVLLADGLTVVTPGSYSLAQIQGLQFRPTDDAAGGPATFSFSVTDNGATNGSADPQTLNESLSITVTEVNDRPERTAGAVTNLMVVEDSGATSLGLDALAYTPGGGSDEAGQTLTFAVTEVPSAAFGNVLLADGVTVVIPGSYTLAQIQGMQFRPADDAAGGGPTTFSFSVTDNGATAGSSDPQMLNESLTITVTEVNDQPERTAGMVDNLVVAEDPGITSLGLESLAYAPGGGADENSQTLTFAVTEIPSAAIGNVLLADGVTVVTPGSYTLAQIQGLQFRPTDDANGGPTTFSFSVTDNGTTNGASDPLVLNESLTITVTEVNDQPERTAGNVEPLGLSINAPATSLGLAGLAYAPGGGNDESGQTLSFAVTAVPPAALGDILLADGLTVVTPGPIDLATLQGLQFRPAPGVSGGPTAFSFSVTDNGMTAGASDPQTLVESLAITVASPETLEVRVAASDDDAEERSGGAVRLSSSDLELTEDRSNQQTIGLRFTGINIPPASTILHASIQFQTDETDSVATSLMIHGELTGDAAQFVSVNSNITSRTRTTASVPWSPAPWDQVGEAGPDQQTPDLASIIQEIVNHPDWVEDNALAIIIDGAGKRVAESFNGVSSAAPLLQIEYSSIPIPNTEPTTVGIPNINTTEDAAAPVVDLFAAFDDDLTADPLLTYTITNNTNPSLFTSTPIDSSAGTFTLNLATDAAGTAELTVRATDTGNPALSVETTFTVNVSEVNDPPERLAGMVDPLVVEIDSGAATLGLGGLDFGPGGGVDEAGQTLQYQVDAVPSLSLGSIVLADGMTVVTPGSYSLAQLQGIQFMPAPGAIGGPETFQFSVIDNGTTGGASDPRSLVESLTITVTPTGGFSETFEARVAASDDDAEERANGDVRVSSSDLELVFDAGGDQTVGIRFRDVTIPQGATIDHAYIQFQVDDPNSSSTSLTIRGEDTNNASPYTTTDNSISSRSTTSASVAWSPVAWNTPGEAGPDQQTPNLAAVIQEIVDRGGWSSGNALAFLITGSGERTADSFDAGSAGAPLLHVEYTPGSPQRAAAPAALNSMVESITSSDLAPLAQAARAQLATVYDPTSVQQLDSVSLNVTDLPGDRLALATGDTILVDHNANGHGWFVDKTPLEHEEFLVVADTSSWPALANGPAANRADLLTAVLHEMGHLLGLEHGEHDSLLDPFLPTGVRRLPDESHAQADDPNAAQVIDSHFRELGESHE